MKISKTTTNALLDNEIRIDGIFLLNLVNSCDCLPDQIWQAYHADRNAFLNCLPPAAKGIKETPRSPEQLLSHLHTHVSDGALIFVSTPVPQQIVFSDSGDFVGYSTNWSLCHQTTIYAKTVELALDKAIESIKEYQNLCIYKDRPLLAR